MHAYQPGVSGLSAYAFTDLDGYWSDVWPNDDGRWPPGNYLTIASTVTVAYARFAENGNGFLGACMDPEPVWVTVD